MTVTVKKQLIGGERKKGDSQSIRDLYKIYGAADEEEAEDALASELPATQAGLLIKGFGVRSVSSRIFEGWADYSPAGKLNQRGMTPDDEEVWEFEGSSSSVTISNAPEVAWWNVLGSQTLPSPANGIVGLGKGGEISGVSVPVSEGVITNRRVIRSEQATSTYLNTLLTSQNCVNDALWRGRAAGEVLFDNFRTTTRSNGDTELIRKWRVKPNVTGLSFGDITGVSKDGHDYVWVHAREVSDPVSNIVTMKPLYVAVVRPLQRIDFAQLEPPTL